ncbi:MAG: acyl carrier protein [Mycoplasmataceae bacterium]|jgi:acyl carrier protein|nr:acyl carrier protein [Mycoplasmataceae bacterium]
MNQNEIFNILKDIAKKNNISINNTHLNVELKKIGVDSLQGINLIIQVEEKCHVTIPDDDLVKIKTPADIINIIIKLQK